VCVYIFGEGGAQKRKWWIVDPEALNEESKGKKTTNVLIYLKPTETTKRKYVLGEGEGYENLLFAMCMVYQENPKKFPLKEHGEKKLVAIIRSIRQKLILF
jgi:hypothetical protein